MVSAKVLHVLVVLGKRFGHAGFGLLFEVFGSVGWLYGVYSTRVMLQSSDHCLWPEGCKLPWICATSSGNPFLATLDFLLLRIYGAPLGNSFATLDLILVWAIAVFWTPFFFFFLVLHCPLRDIRVALQIKAQQPQEQCYPFLSECTVFSCVQTMLHGCQCLGLLTWAQIPSTASEGCTDTVRESVRKCYFCRTGDWNTRQYCFSVERNYPRSFQISNVHL